ncbi:hypothetical protein BCT94_08615 [Vibrio breoganii]|nr:hypothetical protein BCT98_16020 [Vibrio breoganii]PMK75852.1 hypothetical protein BCT94_08615 [Vibrio breoganii]
MKKHSEIFTYFLVRKWLINGQKESGFRRRARNKNVSFVILICLITHKRMVGNLKIEKWRTQFIRCEICESKGVDNPVVSNLDRYLFLSSWRLVEKFLCVLVFKLLVITMARSFKLICRLESRLLV